MWFILDKETQKTVAMTVYRDAAEIIAANFPTECIIRYAGEIGYSENSLFFAVEKEIKKGA